MDPINQILSSGDVGKIRALFSFNSSNTEKEVIFKFNLWGRFLLPGHFTIEDAPFHDEIDIYNYRLYSGKGTVDKPDIISDEYVKYFVDIAFRGAGKDTRTKLFLTFCILNDLDRKRRYIKVVTKDIKNAKQLVTDMYNMMVSKRVIRLYFDTFEKTAEKREERMDSFTTAWGVKVVATTVIIDQRGQQQGSEETARPDFIWFNDFETRKTLKSAVTSQAIWDNMEEAVNGLSIDGGALYTCNYVSERGNVHRLVKNKMPRKKILIVPIIIDGKSAWPQAYSLEAIETLRGEKGDFEGEYMCKPSAGHDIYFDRSTLEEMKTKEPVQVIGGFKIFYKYNPSRRYGGGHDVAGGVGLDSSTSVFIDFTSIPKKVVSTYRNNEIQPDHFGDEIARQGNIYGGCIVGPEKNNHGHATIGRLKQIYNNIYFTQGKKTKVGQDKAPVEYGWLTSATSKMDMLTDLKSAIEKGELQLIDPDLIQEVKDFTRDDLMDRDEDVRLTTRHFDLLMACAIAWQMRYFAEVKDSAKPVYKQPAYETPGIE